MANEGQNVDYTKEVDDGLPADTSPIVKKNMKKKLDSDSDTDFQAPEEDSDDADVPEADDKNAAMELDGELPHTSRSKLTQPSPNDSLDRSFKRAEMPLLAPRDPLIRNGRAGSTESDDARYHPCIACGESHALGFCPLKIAGVEYCNLCGLAHYGFARMCPHLSSVTQLRAMMEAIRHSPESSELKELAKKRVVGIIGDLNQRKRRKQEAQQKREGPLQPSGVPQNQSFSVYGQTNGHWGSGYFVDGTGNKNQEAVPLLEAQGAQ